jgi:hypothetical protein
MQIHKKTFAVVPVIPKGSGDTQWHIVAAQSDSKTVVAIIDPYANLAEPGELAEEICDAMNESAVLQDCI